MTDLSSPELQSTFKKLQRTTIVTNAMMAVVTVAAAAIAVWAGTLRQWKDKSWAEILFFVLIGVLAVYFIFVCVWEIKLRRASSSVLRTFIAEGFAGRRALLCGGEARFELSLAGDSLVVMREGCGEFVQFDLSPVKSFAGVCSAITSYAREYIICFCTLAAQRGEIPEATLSDIISSKPKNTVIVKGGKALKRVNNSYFIKKGIIG